MRIRRVVAGVDERGRSVLLSDGDVPHTLEYRSLPGQAHARIWRTEGAPVTEPPVDEPTTATGPLLPGPGGASFFVLKVAPDSVATATGFDPAKVGAEFAANLPDIAAAMEPDKPGMHRTDSVDYGIVLDGEVILELDDGMQAVLQTGDTFVQLGSRHAWRNRTEQPATVVFVLTGTAG